MPYLVVQEQFKSCCRVGWIIEKSGFKVLITNFKAHISWAAPAVRTGPPCSREAAVRSDWSISHSRKWRRKLRCFQGSDRKSSISQENLKQNQAIRLRNKSTFLNVRTNICVFAKIIFFIKIFFLKPTRVGTKKVPLEKLFPLYYVPSTFTHTYLNSGFRKNKTQITDSKYAKAKVHWCTGQFFVGNDWIL